MPISAMPISDSPEESQSPQTSSSTSPVTPLPALTPVQTQPSPGNPVLRFLGNLFTLIFRVGLLTGGAGLALVVGVAIAAIRPAAVEEPPLLENIIQQVDRFRS